MFERNRSSTEFTNRGTRNAHGRALLCCSVIILSACAASRGGPPPATSRPIDAARLEVFTPRPDGQTTTIDYEVHDAVLNGIVLATGPSLRRTATRKALPTGSRLARGHDSPMRLEGNKVIFSQLNEPARNLIYKLTDATVALADRVDISRLSRNEQLAYWYNVHNLLVISTILKHYPARHAGMIKVGPSKTPLHDAPLAVIRGVPLSLRDIRIGIVYRNWNDPSVLYGFFHGDLASPNIRINAWKGDTISKGLASNGTEFVNAMRGVRRRGSKMLVSPIYKEARETLFPDWPTDLRTHLARFAEPPVQQVLAQAQSVRFSRYESRTADIVGGQLARPGSPLVTTIVGPAGYAMGTGRMLQVPIGSPDFAISYAEFLQKFEDLRRAGKKRLDTDVTILDLDDNEDKTSSSDRSPDSK